MTVKASYLTALGTFSCRCGSHKRVIKPPLPEGGSMNTEWITAVYRLELEMLDRFCVCEGRPREDDFKLATHF